MRCFGGLAVCTAILAGSQICAAAALHPVKIEMTEGHPVIRGVYVNGHGPYSFLLDTGTTANHMDPKLAQRIGLKPTFRSELVSSTGAEYVPGTDGVEVTLGSVHAEGQRFLFTGVDLIRQLEPSVQGVLGQTFLSHFDYLLNVRGKQIEFGKREPNATEIRAPLRIDQARPVVSTSLGALVLDSGTRWVTLFGVQATGPMNEMVTMTGSLRIGTVVRKLLIGGRAFWRGEALAVPHSAEPSAEGLLPVSLFKTVYFCNSEGYVSFE
jgi:Aspartyl protease